MKRFLYEWGALLIILGFLAFVAIGTRIAP